MYVDAQRTSLRRVPPAKISPTPGLFRPSLVNPGPRSYHSNSAYGIVLLLLSTLLLPVVSSLSQNAWFYPYGEDASDNATEKTDDGGSGKITLWQPFPFFAKRHDKLYVNNNGVISFLQNLRIYRPEDFPLTDNTPLIAPYWADVDVQKVGGTVWYRQTLAKAILERADQDVHAYSSAYKRFRSSWAFVATWEEVGYYGAVESGKNKRNTFQCVLVTDGTLSFVIINYSRIEWTTGSNSHGTPETGLGGNPAQAGFNAGDGVNFYEIEGAGTDSVINLTHTSNVCIPGRWIFRVDAPEIQGDSGGLYLFPSSGSMMGGYEVNITGPCFDSARSVQGLIVETNTTFACTQENAVGARTVTCVMPTMFRVGPVTMSVVVDGQQWNYTGDFTFVNVALVSGRVIRHSPKRWRANQGDASISWKSDLFDPETYRNVSVQVMAYKVGDEEEEPRWVAAGPEMVVRNTADNKVPLQLPPLSDTLLAVIRVKVPYRLINGSYLSHWSDVFPVRWSTAGESDEKCSDWLSQEQSRSELTQQAACPCTLKQAESDTGRWQRDPLCSHDSATLYNCIYRGSRTHECIVPTFKGPQTVNQHCCYGDNNELLDVREGGGGSMLERYHFRSRSDQLTGSDQVVPWFSYLTEDVASYLHCCEYASNSSLCVQFRQQRAPVSCQGYKPPAAAQAAGDPHIVTLDGVNYTFNGEGDFILLQDVSGNIRVHVTAKRAVDVDGKLGNATVFTAVAMSVVNETDVVEIRQTNNGGVAVLINQTQVDFTDTQMERRGMTIYRNETGNNTVEFTVVMDTAGISVLVSATPELLNIMVLVGSSELKGNLTGLLGNYNGEKDDDFQSRSGDPVPITANMSDVHYRFGMTWMLPANETLLYHQTAFQDATPESAPVVDYVPIFFDSLTDEQLRNGTVELCQGNLQCIFDFQLTGKESIGASTRKFNDRFESVVKDVAPVVRCPYVQQIANGNRTLEGQAVGQKVSFACDEGYKVMNGSTTLVCLQSGKWNSTTPDCAEFLGMEKWDFLYWSIGGAVGGFVFVIITIFLIRCIVIKCRKKYVPKKNADTESEAEQGIGLQTLFRYSETPNPVFENPLFVTSLQNLRSGEGKFQIPRPRYVDPNIYTEYF
ncbi:sushi domain-containing protein 2-like [Littorina saxatilis]|uniref:sushi domain-containing protein 2-like n=1 Tax=Littorina saxatilis TaxID=31220 RepID=UPI0038B42BD1